MADLKGKIALVTNASCDVGGGMAQGLAEAGATIYLADSRLSSQHQSEPSTLEATAARVEQLGGQAIIHILEPDDGAASALFERIAAEQGALDLLVNNGCQFSADQPSDLPFWQRPLSVWDDHCGVALRGAYVAAVKAADMMVAAKHGLIVNVFCRNAAEDSRDIGRGVAEVGYDRIARDIARALSPHQVTALALRTGPIATPPVLTGIASGTPQADSAHTQSPRFVGRCLAALAMDPDIAEKTGGSYSVAALAAEYRFSEPDQYRSTQDPEHD